MRRFESVSAVLDQEILDDRGKFVGWLCELLVDTAGGRIEYACITLPQGNGAIDCSVVVPWSAMRRTGDTRCRWQITATRQTLKKLARPDQSISTEQRKQMTKSEFISALNDDLATEYRSIVQYIQHIGAVKGAKYQQTVNELVNHVGQELEHAMTLARQIDFLGGTPSNSVPPFDTHTDPKSVLKQDLQLEERQLQRYRQRVEQADELGLRDVAEALSPLLEQTQDHVRELRAVVDD